MEEKKDKLKKMCCFLCCLSGVVGIGSLFEYEQSANQWSSEIEENIDEIKEILDRHDLDRMLEDAKELEENVKELKENAKELNKILQEKRESERLQEVENGSQVVNRYVELNYLDNQRNATTSLYETDEIRYIKSIIMANDQMVTEVDNMDDYELFKSIGFQVKGYNLVNQFSLENDEILTSELPCNKDDKKFEKRMNVRG